MVMIPPLENRPKIQDNEKWHIFIELCKAWWNMRGILQEAEGKTNGQCVSVSGL